MDQEISIGFTAALSQSHYTAEVYLRESIKILENTNTKKSFKISDAIELAKIMCSDFNATVTNIKLQEIRDVLREGKIIVLNQGEED